jgi:hypothetical protein
VVTADLLREGATASATGRRLQRVDHDANPKAVTNTTDRRHSTAIGAAAWLRLSSVCSAFAGILRGRGVAARNPDGTSSQKLVLLLEVDVISSRGTLSL